MSEYYYTFKPKEDITVYELAEIVRLATGRLDPRDVSWLPAEARRHFEEHFPVDPPRTPWW